MKLDLREILDDVRQAACTTRVSDAVAALSEALDEVHVDAMLRLEDAGYIWSRSTEKLKPELPTTIRVRWPGVVGYEDAIPIAVVAGRLVCSAINGTGVMIVGEELIHPDDRAAARRLHGTLPPYKPEMADLPSRPQS